MTLSRMCILGSFLVGEKLCWQGTKGTLINSLGITADATSYWRSLIFTLLLSQTKRSGVSLGGDFILATALLT